MHIASITEKSNYSNLNALIKLFKGRGNVLKGNVQLSSTKKIHSCYMDGDINVAEECMIRESSLGGRITIGDHCRITGARLSGDFQIGRYTSIWGPNIFMFQKFNPIKIGNFCSIGRGVNFQEFNHNAKKITSYLIGSNFFGEKWENESASNGPIVIGNDVWIGANAFVASGVTIGDGCVIASNAVVTKSFPPYSIVAGVPAKIIDYRFDAGTIEELNKLKWWNWDDDKIKKHKLIFQEEVAKEIIQRLISDTSNSSE